MTSTTPGPTDPTHAPLELSDEERALIFAAANAVKNRTPSSRAGKISISPKIALWSIAIFLFLSVGGVLGEHYFPSFGTKSPSTSLMKTTRPPPTTTSATSLNSLPALQSSMGLKFIASASAQNISLTTQSGAPWKLSNQHGKVVVLTFYDATCKDICPVVGAEFKEARRLTKNPNKVEFVIVNTDPQVLSVTSRSPALVVPGLSNYPDVTLLGGSLQHINKVWQNYGVKIKVGAFAGQVSHNDVLYFIGPQGNLNAFCVPFTTLSATGTYSLDAQRIHRFAQGIAETADSLLP